MGRFGGHHDERSQQFLRLERASKFEAGTLVVLVGIAVPLKYLAGWPVLTQFMGPVHGLAFLFYIWTVLQTIAAGGWRTAEVARVLAVAFIPSAGFFNIPWLRRKRDNSGRNERL